MMIKRLLAGVALGYYGKKLHDEGKLDSLISGARDLLNGSNSSIRDAARRDPKASESQPDIAF